MSDSESVESVPKDISLEGLSDFSKLIEVLRAKFVSEKHFSELRTDEERIRYCLSKPDIHLGFDKFQNNVAIKRIAEQNGKDPERAKKYRLEGNKCFKSKKYDDALQFYSRALLVAPFPPDKSTDGHEEKRCNSPNGSSDKPESKSDNEENAVELSLAFANRSATLFHLNLFEDSLANVDHAIEFGYPRSQLNTLLLRKALCLKALDRMTEARQALAEALELMEQDTSQQLSQLNGEKTDSADKSSASTNESYRKFLEQSFEQFDGQPASKPEDEHIRKLGSLRNPQSKLPAANEWVKLSWSESKGRHLITKRAVGKDEPVIIETPFAATLNPQFFDAYCQHCLIGLDGGRKLYPCRDCSYVGFCSEKCARIGTEQYHRHECQNIGALQAAGVLRLALRILLVAGVREALDMSKQFDAQQAQNGAKLSRISSSDYRSVLSLCDHSDQLPYLVAARQTLAAAYLCHVASEAQLGLIQSSDPDYNRFGALILRHIHQISVNSIVIFAQPVVPGPHGITGIDVRNQVIGTGVYPTVGSVNHSCVWNTEQFYRGSVLYLMTRQPIGDGEELTFSYGPGYRRAGRAERMDTLRNQYYFRCDCQACSDQAPRPEIGAEPCTDPDKFEPILTEAFYCRRCRGPLILNPSPESSPCLRCGEAAETETVTEYMDRIEAARKVMNVGKALIQFGRGAEAERQYQRAHNNLSKICWPEHRLLLSVLSELVYVHIFLDQLDRARRYCEEANRIKRLSFGPESAEYMHGQLQLLNLRWQQQKKFDQNGAGSSGSGSERSGAGSSSAGGAAGGSGARTPAMNKRLVQKLCTESSESVRAVKDTVRKSETRSGLVLLDSSLVSCLKELVELERHLKAYGGTSGTSTTVTTTSSA